MSINLLPTTVSIKSKSTSNVGGGQEPTYTTSYKRVPALVTDASSNLRMIYAQRNILVTHMIYFYQPITTNNGDIVVLGSRQFFILSGPLDPSGTGRVFEMACREVTTTEIIVEGP